MSSEKSKPSYRTPSGDYVDPNIVPRLEDIGNIVRLLCDHLNFIEGMSPGEVMVFSIHNHVPLVEIRCDQQTGHTYRVNGQYISDLRWAQMAYMQIVFNALHLDSGTAPSLYYNGDNSETGGTSYAQHSEAN